MVIRKQISNLTKEELAEILSSSKFANKVIEYETEILTNEEKEYLTHLLNFYKNGIKGFNIISIRKTINPSDKNAYLVFFYVSPYIKHEYSQSSCVFPINAMFKGMQDGKVYTLKELNIE